VLRDPDRFRLPDARDSPVAHIAIAIPFPIGWSRAGSNGWALPKPTGCVTAMNTIPPITLRCNRLKNSLAELVEGIDGPGGRHRDRGQGPRRVNLIRPRCPIPEMKAFIDGRFAVQDGAAQLVSLLLAPQPGETVLDACAGLGGKATHLAQLMNNQGTIVAMDNVPDKLIRLEKEAHRLGVSIIRTRRAGPEPAARLEHCPGSTGSYWMHPARAWACCGAIPTPNGPPGKSDIARFARRQARFLDHLAPLVKKNGVMVFAVCSMEPEENEG
jgi:16S rRNA (cytosine967-C5)-methyltransferase